VPSSSNSFFFTLSFFDRYYAILGIDPEASADEVKSAYRALAKLYHPDKSGDPLTRDKFIEVTEAYQAILNKDDLLQEALLRYERRQQGVRKPSPKADHIRRQSMSYADMRFKDFEKTPIYRVGIFINKLSKYIFFPLGFLMIVSPLIRYYQTLYYPAYPGQEPVFDFFPIFIGIAFIYGLWYFMFKKDY